jgi:hypothetical protein
LEERRPYKAKVAGSRPAAPTTADRYKLIFGNSLRERGEFSEIPVAGD